MNHSNPTHTPTRSRVVAIVVTFVVIALAAFFGIQLITKTGLFVGLQPAGRIIFDDTVTTNLRSFVSEALPEDLELASDVTISSQYSQSLLEASPTTILYDVLLPTTDFYDPRQSVTSAEVSAALSPTATDTSDSAPVDNKTSDNTSDGTLPNDHSDENLSNNSLADTPIDSADASPSLTFVSITDLEPTSKVLAIDDVYYLDNFESGAVFAYLTFNDTSSATSTSTSTSPNSSTPAATIANLVQSAIDPLPVQSDVLTLAQTGVTALSRNMTTTLATVDDATYFTANLAPFLTSFDFAHTSNEASFTDAATSSNICSKPAMFDVLTSSGINIVELTGNHNLDCGAEAAISTIDLYHSHDIQTFGGGKSAADAAVPLELSSKSTEITLLGYNESTGGATVDASPGANLYTLEKATSDIAAAKSAGRFVIVDMQFYECNSYDDPSENTTCDYADSSAGDQISTFRTLIDLGADVVVGTSAHQPQTYELYKNGLIFYGLGNLFFDQAWWPGTTRSLILVHYFYKNNHLQTRIVPTVYDSSFQTTLMDTSSAETFLARLLAARPE